MTAKVPGRGRDASSEPAPSAKVPGRGRDASSEPAPSAPPYLDGVLAQPDNLWRSAAAVQAALAGVTGAAAYAMLGTGRIVALGIGASGAAAAGFAAALRGVGRAAVAVNPADLVEAVPAGLGDGYVAISQSGRSRETVEVLAAIEPGRRIGVTNDPGAPLAAVVDAVLPLACDEDTRVSTLSYTATLQALGLLVDALAGRSSPWPAVLAQFATTVLGADVQRVAETLATVSSVDVIGSGVRSASAGAAALLLREAADLPTAGYATREYLHGHLETAGPGRGALLFGAGQEPRLAADLAALGCAVVLVTNADGGLSAHPNLHVVRLPSLPGLAGCVLDILPVQLAAHRLAELSGRPIELRRMPADTKLPP
ncbi:MAG TPA: SIS domain-containing protein [Pilimelia sp.]|nr:SIS domain-containing protein [Pilimelia sp.]